MNPLVTIIVLNWNGWQDTLECLESLYQINYPHYQVIVVDNHSQDESLEKIRKYCQGKIEVQSPFFNYQKENKPLKITEITNKDSQSNMDQKSPIDQNPSPLTSSTQNIILIKNDANYGFARGNNIGIEFAFKNLNPDYILLLNNDTVVDPDFLTKLIQTAEKDDEIGILGPLIYYYDWEGKPDVVANLGGKVNLSKYPGYYDLTEVSSLDDFSDNAIECDWISGAALLMKSSLPLIFLNEKLFFGCEDIDLALLLKEYGYKSVVVPDSHLWHKEGVSRKKRSSDAVKRALMEIKSNLTFLKAHKNHYYWYLPLYFLQIVKIYLVVMLKR